MTEYTRPLLTETDLVEVTGFTQKGKQRQWLDDNNIPYFKKVDGIVVMWPVVEKVMMGNNMQRPDWSDI